MRTIYFIYGLFWLIAIALGIYSISLAGGNPAVSQNTESAYVKGQVIRIEGDQFFVQLQQDEPLTVRTALNEFFLHDDYRVGDLVSLYRTETSEGVQYDIADYYHLDGLILIFILFAVMALLVAKKKGLYSILSIIISLFFLYFFILSAVATGTSILLATLVYVFFLTILTIPLIHGFNFKSLSAIIAVNAGYLIGVVFTYIFLDLGRIGLTPSEEFRTLLIQFPNVDIRQILVASLFLGAVGALIDVAVSICSAVFEGLEEHPDLSFRKANKLGMNVGSDILGSMINTLLIAYIASSLPFLVLMTLARFGNIAEILNYDFIALEMVRIFIGAASIVLIIPITSVFAAYLVTKNAGRPAVNSLK
jgi:uncharacterized membrane protein